MPGQTPCELPPHPSSSVHTLSGPKAPHQPSRCEGITARVEGNEMVVKNYQTFPFLTVGGFYKCVHTMCFTFADDLLFIVSKSYSAPSL